MDYDNIVGIERLSRLNRGETKRLVNSFQQPRDYYLAYTEGSSGLWEASMYIVYNSVSEYSHVSSAVRARKADGGVWIKWRAVCG